MSYPQHYKTLGVATDASPEEIRKVYHELVKKYHPDTHKSNKNAEEKLKAINEAYNVLKDLGKRAEYDYLGRLAQENAVSNASNSAQNDTRFETATESSQVSEELRKFARKQRIKWIINKLILTALFVAYLAFLRTQANPEKPYDLLQTLHNSSLTFRRSVQNGANYISTRAQDIYYHGSWRNKVLFFAVRHNRKSLLEFLLQHLPAEAVDDVSGESLLMAAEDVDIAKLLLDHGAEVNYVNPRGDNALIVAVRKNNTELAEALLVAGADASYISADGNSALKVAAGQNNAQMTSLLMKYGAKVPWHKQQKKP